MDQIQSHLKKKDALQILAKFYNFFMFSLSIYPSIHLKSIHHNGN